MRSSARRSTVCSAPARSASCPSGCGGCATGPRPAGPAWPIRSAAARSSSGTTPAGRHRRRHCVHLRSLDERAQAHLPWRPDPARLGPAARTAVAAVPRRGATRSDLRRRLGAAVPAGPGARQDLPCRAARGRAGQRRALPAPAVAGHRAARHRQVDAGVRGRPRARLGPVLRWPITSRSTLQDGLYRYDAIGRAAGRDQPGPTKRPSAAVAAIGRYIRLGPLGTALLPTRRPRVLLIDEIDKSDIDLPNDLLNVFEEGEFDDPRAARAGRRTPSTSQVLTGRRHRRACRRARPGALPRLPVRGDDQQRRARLPAGLPAPLRPAGAPDARPGPARAPSSRAHLGAEAVPAAQDLIEPVPPSAGRAASWPPTSC